MKKLKHVIEYSLYSLLMVFGNLLLVTSCSSPNSNDKSQQISVTVQDGSVTNSWSDWEDYTSNVTGILHVYESGRWLNVSEINTDNETYDEFIKRTKYGPKKLEDLKVQQREKGDSVQYRIKRGNSYYPVTDSPVKGFRYCFYYNSNAYCFNM